MASTYLTKTFAQAGNRRTFTISYWIKMGYVSTTADGGLFHAAQDGSNSDDLYIHTGRLNFSGYYGSTAYQVRTTAKYRDLSGWYHHVIRFDSTQSTASDRLRLYVNGELQTALDSNTYPSQNLETTYINTARQHTIGSFANGSLPNAAFNGSMSHFHFCDGYSYGADSFGETDTTTGIWKPKTAPSVTYGTNGFFLKFENSGAMGTDSSGQGNNWTVNGSMTQLIDTPSNVFCTANPLALGTSTVLSNGNTTARNDTSNNSTTLGTIGFGNGKYYWEGYRHGGGNIGIGVCNAEVSGSDNNSVTAGRVLYYENGTIFCEGLSDQSNITTGVTYGDTDIISVSMDTENGILKFYKNDTLVNNSTITNSKFTNAENIWLPHTYQNNGGEWRLNFGNGYFGTTAISSQGTNASNIGKFEYDVKPSDATAVSTKGLNE